MLLQPLPRGGERPPAAETYRLAIDEPYTSAPPFAGNRLAAVFDQDTDNFQRQWAGIKAAYKTGATLGNYQEARIRHFHNTLDRYMADSHEP